MNQLDRLEALAQRLIEGAFDRLFRTRLPSATVHENGASDRIKIEGLTTQKASHWLLRLGERELRLGEPVIRIGRALDNDIVLTDPAVSRYHAQLRWRHGCYHLCPPTPTTDDITIQRNGDNNNENQPIPQTTVNHQQVIQHPLIPDDVIILGETKLTVMVETGTA